MTKKMKITFITGHLCKERHALLNELVLDLGEYGAEVTVLTGFPSRRITESVRKYYLNNPVERISENVTVKRIGSKKGEGKGLISRLIKYYFLSKKLYSEAKKTETDIYFLYSTPFFLGYVGKKLKKIAPTVYNAQDLFPDTLIHAKHLKETNPIIKFFRRKETAVYRENTHIITISEQMKNTIIRCGGVKNNISVIYNWADTKNLNHIKKQDNSLYDLFNIDRNKFVVSYAGDLGLFQGWDNILTAAKSIMEKEPNIIFVLIGNGSYKEEIEKTIKREGINNVFLFPLQPPHLLSQVYSFGDIELLPIEKGITKMALPSKSGVIMATGSPVLAIVDKGSDIDAIIKNNNIGISIEPGDSTMIESAILHAYTIRESLAECGIRAKKFAEINYSRKTQTKKYYQTLEEICNNAK